MHQVRLASETDFAGWRAAARALRLGGVAPDDVVWTVAGEDDLFASPALPPERGDVSPFTTPRIFVELAEAVVLHRAPERFALLYRLLWRMAREPGLAARITDPDMARAREMARNVSRASHKMKAFVRFRLLDGVEPETFAAWFEPAHRVTERTAPFFARRFTAMRFSILTPDLCAHWDGAQLEFSPGASADARPDEDALEAYWLTYYGAIFNPARLKVKAMQAEMPKRYWANLPEARLIPELIASARERTDAMIAEDPSQPSAFAGKAVRRPAASRLPKGPHAETLDEVAAGVDACRRCDLWRDATQGVSGEGDPKARLMFVGEQPGDQEDLAGRPFVGPAGQLFDRALAEAGVPRAETWITNAVKHFKHELRGKRRLHKTPATSEVSACRWWIDEERRLVRPRVIVSLGATAALSVVGKATPIAANRGRPIPLLDEAQAVVTWHPSFLLRAPDEATRERAYGELVEDLRLAWSLAAA